MIVMLLAAGGLFVLSGVSAAVSWVGVMLLVGGGLLHWMNTRREGVA